MNRIADLEAFVAIVEKGSLTAAARQLGRSLQSVSRSLAAMEQEVGVELVRRTTRQASPTETGLVLHERLRLALADIADAKSRASHGRVEPSGLLRVGSPGRAGTSHVLPAIAAFLDAHPKIEVDLQQYDGFVDPADFNLDVAIRVGASPDSALKSKHLADWRRVFVAAPAYLDRHGRPKRPADLLGHQCIVRTARPGANVWPFTAGGKKVGTIAVAGRFRTSGGPAVMEVAVLGLGIAIAPFWQVQPHVKRKSLELVLVRYEPPPIPVYAVWTATRVLPAKTRMFIDFMSKRLRRDAAQR